MSAQPLGPLAHFARPEFVTLMKHCLTCTTCEADTDDVCTDAARLRDAWERTWEPAAGPDIARRTVSRRLVVQGRRGLWPKEHGRSNVHTGNTGPAQIYAPDIFRYRRFAC